jgi:hypothetical protein
MKTKSQKKEQPMNAIEKAMLTKEAVASCALDGETQCFPIEPKITFEYEYYETPEEVRMQIQECEGKHTQQVCYSTFHDALTQICFGCKKIRTMIKQWGNTN